MEHNLALEIMEDIGEELGADSESFEITDDDCAEWALRKIAEHESDAARFIETCEKQKAFYDERIAWRESKLEKETSYLTHLLNAYFLKVPHKKTKTQETYQLPSGTLKLKLQSPEFNKDDDKLVGWLKKHDMGEYVKVKESAAWADLKKSIIIDDENVIFASTGEVIEGVKVEYRPDKFIVETSR